jgi:hypothetical protein
MPCHAGVIWKGDKLIDGVPETLDMLHAMGKRLVFVTNNSTKSRKQYAKKFDSLGLNVAEEEIFASSFAAAAYLKSVNFPSNKKLELTQAGISHIGGPVFLFLLLQASYIFAITRIMSSKVGCGYVSSFSSQLCPCPFSFHILWRLLVLI